MESKPGLSRRDFLWGVGTLSSMALLSGAGFAFDEKMMAATAAKDARLSAAW